VALVVLERHRHAQALGPFAQGLRLHLGRRTGGGQRALYQVAPGGDALGERGLAARPFLVHVALDEPAGGPGEERERHDDREPDAQVERTQEASGRVLGE
jgi:hypothetical protein